MKWIALTGGLGSGKSTSARLLREMGYSVVDADVLSREVIAKGTSGFEQVVTTFGQQVLDTKGDLDRSALAKIVFQDKSKLAQLEAIVHPLVGDAALEKRRELESQGQELAFYDIPLLFEKNLQPRFDGNILVYCNRQKQIERISERENWSAREIENRLASQLSIEDKKQMADFVVNNSGSLADLKNEISRVVKEIKNS